MTHLHLTPAPSQRLDAQSSLPVHRAEELTEGGVQARILLRDQTYVLRITRAGKLILTK